MLYISESLGKGRGVYTDKKIERDTIIERCPVLEIPAVKLSRLLLQFYTITTFAGAETRNRAP